MAWTYAIHVDRITVEVTLSDGPRNNNMNVHTPIGVDDRTGMDICERISADPYDRRNIVDITYGDFLYDVSEE